MCVYISIAYLITSGEELSSCPILKARSPTRATSTEAQSDGGVLEAPWSFSVFFPSE